MTAEILNTESGTEALYRLLEKGGAPILLPADICSSVTEGFRRWGLKFDFYRVGRAWCEEGDIYGIDSSPSIDTVHIFSDLFNFRSIKLEELRGKRVVLDLAHCSFSTGEYYVNEILRRDIQVDLIGIVFSFGAGKYLRRGGGGCLIRGAAGEGSESYKSFSDRVEKMYGPKELKYVDVDLISRKFKSPEIFSNSYSTRMVVRPARFKEGGHKVEDLRRHHKVDVSDGIFDHLALRRRREFYVWKGVET